MAGKDIIFQVSEETANVMDEISNLMYEEADEKFEEIKQVVTDAIRRIEDFEDAFEEYANKTKRNAINKEDILGKFDEIKLNLDEVKRCNDEQFLELRNKEVDLSEVVDITRELVREIIESIKKVEGETLNTKEDIRENSEKISEKICLVEDSVKLLAEKIAAESVKNIIDELDNNFLSIKAKTTDCENKINEVSDKLNGSVEDTKNMTVCINEYYRTIKEEQEVVLQKSNDLLLENQQIKGMISNLEEMMKTICSMTSSINQVAEIQKEIVAKQETIEKDINYLKLPFYKKWFMKGE